MAFDSPSYDDIVQAVLSCYDSNSAFWGRVNNGTATAAEIYDAYSRLPQLKITRNMDGYILGTDWSQSLNKLSRVDYADPDPTARELLDSQINSLFSNSGAADYGEGNAYNVNVNGNWGGNGTTGYNVTSGAQIPGSGSTIATIADRAALAVTGVNIGAKLGAKIDEALYSLDPEWWNANYPAINPQTWTSLAGENELGKQFIRVLFGVKDSGVTAYVDEKVLAQTYQMFRDKGVWNTGGKEIIVDEEAIRNKLNYTWTDISIKNPIVGYWRPGVDSACVYRTYIPNGNAVITATHTGTQVTIIAASKTPATVTERIVNIITGETSERVITLGDGYSSQDGVASQLYFINNPLVINSLSDLADVTDRGPFIIGSINELTSVSGNQSNALAQDWLTIISNSEIKDVSPVDGITPIGGSWQYPPTNITGTDVDTVLQQLKQQYPDLFTDSITESTLQDDGTIQDRTYVPIPWAIDQPITQTDTDELIDTETQPTTKTETEIDTDVDPETFTDIVIRTPTDNPPDEGEGEQSPFVMPVGNASSLWAVYHPSQAELNAFGAWLWSSDFVEQLKRLFNDPMQAIIGVHKVFAPIPTGGSQTIKCGYLDSGVSSPTVSSQYTEVNCGTVDCWEYFGNVFDYDPHTKVSIYLPFIGVVPLKVSEVMRASINVSYGVDVITGACLAKVKVMRDGGGGILYSYGGSCACHYPISSGSYAGIISGIVTSAIGIAGGIATGNPLAAIGGAVAGLHQAHTDVQRSGGFTGCAGAMGPKKPYLIIDRPQTKLAPNFETYQGKPANTTQFIGDCAGFVRATEVHFSAPGAFDDEAKEVEALLKSGVLISD